MKRHLHCAEQPLWCNTQWNCNIHVCSRNTWNVIHSARSNRCHPPKSPNTVPATTNGSHDRSSSHKKRRLQCAEQQNPPSKLTKYCACHEKLTLMIDPCHIIKRHLQPSPDTAPATKNGSDDRSSSYMRSNRTHPPTSPNTSPATKNNFHATSFTMHRATELTFQSHQIVCHVNFTK